MCDVTYIEPQPTNPSGGGTPAVRRPLVAGLESEGKCLPRGISEALRCTERGRDGNFNTHCDNVCDAGAEEGSYCICRRSALSKKRDARHKKTDNQSGGDSPQNPTKKRKQDGASGGRTPAKIQKL